MGTTTAPHPQDAVVIVPAFDGANVQAVCGHPAHHLDIAAKDPYCTDTTDNFQEGVIFPAVKVYAGGELQRDMYRTILANSRAPKALEGDKPADAAANADRGWCARSNLTPASLGAPIMAAAGSLLRCRIEKAGVVVSDPARPLVRLHAEAHDVSFAGTESPRAAPPAAPRSERRCAGSSRAGGH